MSKKAKSERGVHKEQSHVDSTFIPPAWLSDPSLLPKRPPGKGKEVGK